MVMTSVNLQEDYWQSFKLQEADIEFLYRYLLEEETPLTSGELMVVLIEERIQREIKNLEKQRSAGGETYLPNQTYNLGQNLVFPALNWRKGEVIDQRPGRNPDSDLFEVITVKFDNGEERQFASGLEDHILNNPPEVLFEVEALNPDYVISHFSEPLIETIELGLIENDDFVRIAGRWFPLALLLDINVGHLNLAEAVLDMAGGGPLDTTTILEQVEIETSENTKLLEFSFDYALEEDERFDEVGPAGKVLWFLKREEPDEVQSTPIYLKYSAQEYDPSVLIPEMRVLEQELDDELTILNQTEFEPNVGEAEIRLIFPHWQAGTLPLSSKIQPIFPTAYEAPRVLFTLQDGETGDKFPGWVVRNQLYVYGLKQWYAEQGLQPGSIVKVREGNNPGEVIVQAGARRSSRDWMKTILVGSDGGIVFAMLRQIVEAEYDERMAIAVPDVENLEKIWLRSEKKKPTLERVVVDMVRELTKLNPQGHVHTSELYAAVNLVYRCPPGPILALLASRPWFIHVGDLHFRFDDSEQS